MFLWEHLYINNVVIRKTKKTYQTILNVVYRFNINGFRDTSKTCIYDWIHKIKSWFVSVVLFYVK